MKTSDFNYALPAELIAQSPSARRDGSRLLCLDRRCGVISHRLFNDLPSQLKPGDRLVLNDTRVIPARLRCRKPTGGRVEILFVKREGGASWIAMVRPGRRLKAGCVVVLEPDPAVMLSIGEAMADGHRRISLLEGPGDRTIDSVLARYGEMPLPPYIGRLADTSDRERYQTVFAHHDGAVAAPTAGLHFTRELLADLEAMGVGISFVTLHVGLGTFKPVSEEDPTRHHMHEESYVLNSRTVSEIAATRAMGGRIIAVGTTVVRVLEHCAATKGVLGPSEGTTRLFILPGYPFRVVDAVITNFHLPHSTLLMLVCAFAGTDRVMAAYGAAISERYRFFSYGDAMFIH